MTLFVSPFLRGGLKRDFVLSILSVNGVCGFRVGARNDGVLGLPPRPASPDILATTFWWGVVRARHEVPLRKNVIDCRT